MEKRIAYVGVRLSDTEKQSLEARAAEEGCSVSDLVRRLAMDGGPCPAPVGLPPQPAPVELDRRPPARAITSHHVDELGADPLRCDSPALTR